MAAHAVGHQADQRTGNVMRGRHGRRHRPAGDPVADGDRVLVVGAPGAPMGGWGRPRGARRPQGSPPGRGAGPPPRPAAPRPARAIGGPVPRGGAAPPLLAAPQTDNTPSPPPCWSAGVPPPPGRCWREGLHRGVWWRAVPRAAVSCFTARGDESWHASEIALLHAAKMSRHCTMLRTEAATQRLAPRCDSTSGPVQASKTRFQSGSEFQMINQECWHVPIQDRRMK